MSSSRSVAAARARRAGGDQSSSRPSQLRSANQPAKPQPQQSTGKSQNNMEAGDGRLSVSDAFALVTIRLGRVEMALQKLDIHNIASSVAEDGGSSTAASSVVLKSIVSRIDDLEKSIDDNISGAGMTDEQNDTITGLQSTVAALEKELRDAKDAIYKLQSFALDMNQKIGSNGSLSKSSKAKHTSKTVVLDLGQIENDTSEATVGGGVQTDEDDGEQADEEDVDHADEEGEEDEEDEEDNEDDGEKEQDVVSENGDSA